jgi:hypothetical protein
MPRKGVKTKNAQDTEAKQVKNAGTGLQVI